MAEEDKGAIAFHIVMALCSDLALHEPHRIEKMRGILQGLQRQRDIGHPDDLRDLRSAEDALRRLVE